MLMNNSEYIEIIEAIKSEIIGAQYKAALNVNRELIMLYYNIGKIINEHKLWGNKFIENLAADIKLSFPNAKGYSVRNLKYMAKLAATYDDEEFVQQAVAQIPWGHTVVLLDKFSDSTIRNWYVKKTIENGWSRITIKGTVGTQSINGTYYVYILGFNHNSAKEGNGIHFGGFKTALTGGADICLIDSHYNTSASDTSKWFNMNHSSSNTNAGGWKGCDMRYDILGSTKSKNTDAATNTATSPVANTLMAALPSDLRAVMQPMDKYTDNTGGGSNTASYVTKTVDYLPLLAEFEIFGARSYANSAEQNYQAQYAYYSSGNSKVKNQHTSTGSAAYWWERSPNYNNSNNFCNVNTNGNANNNNARNSNGVAPDFKRSQ